MEKRLYITRNMINGKVYAGKHMWKEGTTYMGSGYALKKAFVKYGKKNFKIRWLKLNIKSSEDLDRKEIRLIRLLKRWYKNRCYNIQKGGCGGYFTYYMSDEQKQEVFRKISEGKKRQYANGETEKQLDGRRRMRMSRLKQYQDPIMKQRYVESHLKRVATMSKRHKNGNFTEGERRRNEFLKTNSIVYRTYKLQYPDGVEIIETKSLKEFQLMYNTEDNIFSQAKLESGFKFKRRTSRTKHPFPAGTILYIISEEKRV